jgi:hypothetical protein
VSFLHIVTFFYCHAGHPFPCLFLKC